MGYFFDTSSDTLRLNYFELDSDNLKRQCLSQIAKVFGPSSLFLPVTIRGRLLMRKTWKQEISWDDEIDSALKTWEKLLMDLISLKDTSFKRSCFVTEDSDMSFNIFCDARFS